jgi:long-chain fatty acid transport protein
MKKIAAILLAFCPVLLSAQGFTVQTQGLKQQAMGNAGTAFIQDAATVFYNPAGMASLKENSFTVGGNYISINSLVQDSSTRRDITSERVAYTISAYGVYGFDSAKSPSLQNLKFGLGVYTPFGSGVEFENNWFGRFMVEKSELKTITIQPSASYKVFDNLSVGGGLMATMGSFSKSKDINLIDSLGTYSNMSLSGDFMEYGANIGVIYNPIEAITIGVSYRTAMEANIDKGEFIADSIPSSLQNEIPATGNFSTMLALPSVFSIGLAYKLSDKLDITGDYNSYGYKAFKEVAIDFDVDHETSELDDQTEVRNLENAYAMIIGVQYKIMDALSARIGGRYVTGATPDGYVTPDGADASRFAYSIGAGYQIGSFLEIDAFTAFEALERSDRNEDINFYANYKTNVITSGLSITYKY